MFGHHNLDHAASACPVLLAVPRSRAFSLSAVLPHTSVLSVCRDLVVMILSVRLVSCQMHRIHSGLLLMLTLMFLYFTRKGENGCVLALLSTNTP